MYRRVIIREIIRHGFDLFLHLRRIRPFFQYHEALSRVLLPGGQIRILSLSHGIQRGLYRNRILLAVPDALYPAYGVGMPLADALSPERIILSIRKDRIGIQPVQREHPRIPAHGYDSHLTAFFRRLIHPGKMLRDPCMGIEAVYHMEQLRIDRSLFGKIRRAPAAQDHHIDPVLPVLRFGYAAHTCTFCQDLYICRIPAGKDCRQLHIRILLHGTFHTPAQIAIA